MLVQIDDLASNRAASAEGGSGTDDYWWLVLIPFLLGAVVYRKAGRRPEPAKATPLGIEGGAFEAMTARAVSASPAPSASTAFDTVIGGLLAPPLSESPQAAEEAIIGPSVHATPQHAVLGAAVVSLAFIDPDTLNDENAVTFVPEFSTLNPIVEVSPAITRNASYTELLGVSEHEGDAMTATVVPVRALVRTNSYFDTLDTEPSDVASLQSAHTAGSAPPGMTFVTPEPDHVRLSSAFGNRNSIFVGDNDSVRFKSVHRINPLASLAKQNRRVAVVADELEGLEMHNPVFTQTSAGAIPGEVGQMAVPSNRLSISLAESFAQDIDLDDADEIFCDHTHVVLAGIATQDIVMDNNAKAIPGDQTHVALAGIATQDITVDDSAEAISGDQPHVTLAGSGTHDIDLDSADTLDDRRSIILAAGSGRQDINVDTEVLAFLPSVRVAPLGDIHLMDQDDDQEGYLAVAGDGVPIAHGQSEGQGLDQQSEYLAVAGDSPGVFLTSEANQDGHLAFTAGGAAILSASSANRPNVDGGDDDPDQQEEYLAVEDADQEGGGDSDGDNQQEEHLAVEDADQEGYLAVNGEGHSAGSIRHGRCQAQLFANDDDQDGYLAVNAPTARAWGGSHPTAGGGNNDDADDQDEYLAVNAPTARPRSGSQPTVDDGDDGDGQDEYLAVNAPTARSRGGAQPTVGNGDDDDGQDEYLAVNAPTARARDGAQLTVGGGGDDDEQDEYLGVIGSGADDDNSSDSQSEYVEMFDRAAISSAKLVQTHSDMQRDRPGMLPDEKEEVDYVAVGGSQAGGGGDAEGGSLATQWVVGADGESVAISSARMVWLDGHQSPASRPMSATSAASSETDSPAHGAEHGVFFARKLQLSDSVIRTDEANADPEEGELPDQFFGKRAENDTGSNLVLDDRFFGLRDVHLDAKEGATVDNSKSMHFEEHGAIGTALRAPNGHGTASPQDDWRLSAAAWSDDDDGDAPAAGDDVAEAVGGVSASMFGAASRKIGVRPSNRRIGANFGGRFRQRQAAPPPVETEDIFVADMQAKRVRLASIQKSPRGGRNEMTAAAMTEEKTA